MAVREDLVDELVDFMNEMLAHDQEAITALCLSRVQCGKALMTHPTVQVLVVRDDVSQSMDYSVGLLGILNGFLGSFDEGPKKGFGALVADMDGDTGEITGFRRLENTETGL